MSKQRYELPWEEESIASLIKLFNCTVQGVRRISDD